ncbi:hypothetical protein STREPTOSP366_20370 [Streptomyces variabilis]
MTFCIRPVTARSSAALDRMSNARLIWNDVRVSTAWYESHVTVRCSGSAEHERLNRWCAAAGLKLTRIVLARAGCATSRCSP